jgi:hypothetical protein
VRMAGPSLKCRLVFEDRCATGHHKKSDHQSGPSMAGATARLGRENRIITARQDARLRIFWVGLCKLAADHALWSNGL